MYNYSITIGGVSDLILLKNGVAYFLEVKRLEPKTYQTADQKEFEKFATLARKIAERDNIVNVAAIFARMLEIVDNELKDKEKPKKNLKAKK